MEFESANKLSISEDLLKVSETLSPPRAEKPKKKQIYDGEG